jgi:hypothetical protein
MVELRRIPARLVALCDGAGDSDWSYASVAEIVDIMGSQITRIDQRKPLQLCPLISLLKRVGFLKPVENLYCQQTLWS